MMLRFEHLHQSRVLMRDKRKYFEMAGRTMTSRCPTTTAPREVEVQRRSRLGDQGPEPCKLACMHSAGNGGRTDFIFGNDMQMVTIS
jgi:hypothetical protein